MKYIIDSSVLLTWILSPSVEMAENIFSFIKKNRKNLYSHAWVLIEISNVLVMHLDSLQRVEEAYQGFLELDITVLDVDSALLHEARNIAFMVKDTVYDASYHALAIEYDYTFITCDERYFNKANHLGNIKLYTMLEGKG